MAKYLRQMWDTDIVEEMAEEHWMENARCNTRDIDLAKIHGFNTANAHYWTEMEAVSVFDPKTRRFNRTVE